MAMVIDAMDLLYARNLDGFAIVSSDADFTPLVMRLRNDGLAVYGFGQEKTPQPFVRACSTFLYLEKLGQPEEDADNGDARPAPSADQLQDDAELVRLLRGAIDATQGEDGWSRLGAVGSHIGNQGSFDSRNYGYRKLSDLIEAVGLFEVRRQGQVIEVRARRRGRGGRAQAAAPAAKAAAAKAPVPSPPAAPTPAPAPPRPVASARGAKSTRGTGAGKARAPKAGGPGVSRGPRGPRRATSARAARRAARAARRPPRRARRGAPAGPAPTAAAAHGACRRGAASAPVPARR